MTGPYVIQFRMSGQFWVEPPPGARHGSWCVHRHDATQYPRRADVDAAVASLRAKFNRHLRSNVEAQPLHPAPVFDPMRRHPSAADLTLPLNFEGVAA